MELSMLIAVIILSTIIPLALSYLFFRRIKQFISSFASNLIPTELSIKRSTAGRKGVAVKKAKIQAKHVASAKNKMVSNIGNINPLLGQGVNVLKGLGLTNDEIFATLLDPNFQRGGMYIIEFAMRGMKKLEELVGKGSKSKGGQWA